MPNKYSNYLTGNFLIKLNDDVLPSIPHLVGHLQFHSNIVYSKIRKRLNINITTYYPLVA